MFSKVVSFNAGVVVALRWPDFKPIAALKDLRIQYIEAEDRYTIFALDADIVYHCELIKLDASAEWPFANYSPDYDQKQNDSDVTEFVDQYKGAGNRPVLDRQVAAIRVEG